MNRTTRINHDWERGYFCAVANLVKLEGELTTQAKELLYSGGDWGYADDEDKEVFIKYGADNPQTRKGK